MAKYLSLSERIRIEKLLESTRSFKAIGRELDRDCNTIRNEITRHIIRQQTGCFGHAFNDCANRFSCDIRCLCGDCTNRHTFCRFCGRCHLHCRDYSKLECRLLNHPPADYVDRYRQKLGEDGYRKTCAENAPPVNFEKMSYPEFLKQRRKLMAGIVKQAYYKLSE